MNKDIELTLDELWEKYHENCGKEDEEIYRNRLMEHYMTLPQKVVDFLHLELPPSLDSEDLASYGIFGLMNAIKSYDETIGRPFKNYAFQGIRRSILNELQNDSCDFSRYQRSRRRQLREAIEVLKNNGIIPDEENLINELLKDSYQSIPNSRKKSLKMSPEEKAKRIIKDAKALERIIFMKYDENLVDKNALNPLRKLEEEDRDRFLKEDLSDEERFILESYYSKYCASSKKKYKEFWKGMSMNEIAKILGVTTQAISLRHQTILRKLRDKLLKRGYTTLESCMENL